MSIPTRERRKQLNLEQYVTGVLANNRTILSRAITLVESTRSDHREQARLLLTQLMGATGKALRIGISGVPGVGKSTFIESFGSMLTAQGLRLAVLAVDPSSTISGGSILGDKTRMTKLSNDPLAYVRPSPTTGALGGVADKTRETLLLCEAAGYEVILVETVGVGQSEIEVAGMTDFFMALMLPGAGDELQGIKRGIVEIADMLVVNKADGEFLAKAKTAARQYRTALHFMTPKSGHWQPPVLIASGLMGTGLETIWEKMTEYRSTMMACGEWQEKRQRQSLAWMWSMIERRLASALKTNDKVRAIRQEVENAVLSGQLPASAGANQVISTFFDRYAK